MRRSTLMKVAVALEDLMCETGEGKTAGDRKIWATCHHLWILIQQVLRRGEFENEQRSKQNSESVLSEVRFEAQGVSGADSRFKRRVG